MGVRSGGWARRLIWVAIALTTARCGEPRAKTPRAVAARDRSAWVHRSFDFRAPSGAVVSSETMRGRATALLFVTTHDIRSQFALRQLGLILETFQPRANAAAVVVQPPHFAALLSTFEQTLGLPFPAVMADYATLAGNGPFGPLPGLPAAVVLDRYGYERARLGADELSEQTLRARLRQATAVSAGQPKP